MTLSVGREVHRVDRNDKEGVAAGIGTTRSQAWMEPREEESSGGKKGSPREERPGRDR